MRSAPAPAASPARGGSSRPPCDGSRWHRRIWGSAHAGHALWRRHVGRSPHERKNPPAQAGATSPFRVVSVMLVWVWRPSATAGLWLRGQGQSVGKRCGEMGSAVRAAGKRVSTCKHSPAAFDNAASTGTPPPALSFHLVNTKAGGQKWGDGAQISAEARRVCRGCGAGSAPEGRRRQRSHSRAGTVQQEQNKHQQNPLDEPLPTQNSWFDAFLDSKR